MNPKSRQRYTAEFKAQAVELINTGKPISQIAEELCIGSNLRSLRREVALLKMESNILKKPQSSSAPDPSPTPGNDRRHPPSHRPRHPTDLRHPRRSPEQLLPRLRAH
ncbi:MAG: transposase, partial [Luteolibacter sp.]